MIKGFLGLVIASLFTTGVVANDDYLYRYNLKGVQHTAEPKEPKGPDGWTLTGVNVDELYPTYSDASSSGSAYFDFNFGQRAFKGDPKGFSPYDPGYDTSLWSGAYLVSENKYRTLNLNSAHYKKTYNSGKYYYEIDLSGNPHADLTGFSSLGYGRISKDPRGVGVNRVGSYSGFQSKTKSQAPDYERWISNNQILSSDTIQVWVDFDNDRILIKELGVPLSSYVNVEN